MSTRKHIKDASNAHTRLNTFYAVMYVLESLPGGSTSAQRTAAKIIDLCNAEASRQLKAYDAAVRLAEKPHD